MTLSDDRRHEVDATGTPLLRYLIACTGSVVLSASALGATPQVVSAQLIAEGAPGSGHPLEDVWPADFEGGSALAALPDLNGDGIGDLALGGINRVWILGLNSDGSVNSVINNFDGTALGLTAGWGFGKSLAWLGDFNGQGAHVLAVGAFSYPNDCGENLGVVFLLSLNPDGTIASHVKIDSASDASAPCPGALGRFGESIALLQDLDMNGVRDIAVGARYDIDGAETGAVEIILLDPAGAPIQRHRIADGAGGLPAGSLNAGYSSCSSSDGDRFGISTCSIEDLDGDGIEELAVGAFRAFYDRPPGPYRTGIVWVLSLDQQAILNDEADILKNHWKIPASEGGFDGDSIDELDHCDQFGLGITRLPDFDCNGYRDIAVAAVKGGGPGQGDGAGAVWILGLSYDPVTGPEVVSWIEIADGVGGFQHPGQEMESHTGLGRSMALLGDLDGQGGVELAVGAPGEDGLACIDDPCAGCNATCDENSGGAWILFTDLVGVPEAPANPLASSNAICPGAAVSLSATVPNGVVLDWFSDACGSMLSGTGTYVGTGNPFVVPNQSATTTYYARARCVAGTNQVESDDCSVGVTVDLLASPPPPTNPTASPPEVCTGESVALNVDPPGPGLTVLWYADSCGGTPISDPSNALVSQTTTFFAQLMDDATGCTGGCAQVTVTVTSPDDPAPTALDSVLCPGESTTLMASVPGSDVYWYDDTCGGTVIGIGDSVPVSPLVTTTYYARAWDPLLGCFSVACGEVTVEVPDAPTIAPLDDQAFCPGETVQLAAVVTGHSQLSLRWRKDGCDLADGGNVSGADSDTLVITNASAADEGVYDLVVTQACTTVADQVAISNGVLVEERSPKIESVQAPVLSTLSGSTATFLGRHLLPDPGDEIVVTVRTENFEVIVENVTTYAAGDQLDVVLPAIPPGCDCGSGATFFADVRFDTACGSTTLFESGLALEFAPAVQPVTLLDDLQAIVDAAPPGTCLQLIETVDQGEYATTQFDTALTIGPAKSAITLTRAPDPQNTAGDYRIRGDAPPAGGVAPQAPAILIDSCGDDVCVSSFSVDKGNSGIWITGPCSPIVDRMLLFNNTSDSSHGGGLTILDGATPIVAGCSISANVGLGDGGAVVVREAGGAILDNFISGNTAAGSGGGLFLLDVLPDLAVVENSIWNGTSDGDGGGIYLSSTLEGVGETALIALNDIRGNEFAQSGGGIYLGEFVSSAKIAGNTIRDNEGTTGEARGGGIFVEISSDQVSRICDNLIFGNIAQAGGGLAIMNKVRVTVERNVIACNVVMQITDKMPGPMMESGAAYAAGILCVDNESTLRHNTIWNNTGFSPGGLGDVDMTELQSPLDQGGGLDFRGSVANFEFADNLLQENEGWELFTDEVMNDPLEERVHHCIAFDLPPHENDLFSPDTFFTGSPPANVITGQDPLMTAPSCSLLVGAALDTDAVWGAFGLLPRSIALGAASDGASHMGAALRDGYRGGDCLGLSSGDCNANGMDDTIDLAAGVLSDENLNGVPDECECGIPAVYCTSKVNSLGCVPSISFTGAASLSGDDDLFLNATEVLGGTTGVLVWGLSPAAPGLPGNAAAFGSAPLGITPCVLHPRRTGIQSSGGTPGFSDGSFSFHFSQSLMSSAGLLGGSTVYAQYWYSDPGHPDGTGAGHTEAARFTICE